MPGFSPWLSTHHASAVGPGQLANESLVSSWGIVATVSPAQAPVSGCTAVPVGAEAAPLLSRSHQHQQLPGLKGDQLSLWRGGLHSLGWGEMLSPLPLADEAGGICRADERRLQPVCQRRHASPGHGHLLRAQGLPTHQGGGERAGGLAGVRGWACSGDGQPWGWVLGVSGVPPLPGAEVQQ